MKIFCRSLVVLLCVFAMAGCADLLDPNVGEREENVGYSTLYDLLDQRGEYTYFLEAVDLIPDLQKKLQGSSLVTVFAPNDEVFGTYLAGQFGAESVADVVERGYLDELTVLVGYHMVQYSYRPVDFLAFSMSGNAVVPQEGDGSCYKYLTFARDEVERVADRLDYEYDVFSRERYLPVMSSRLWETRGFSEADAKYNYERLFPSVLWAGMDDQLYVGSAVVTESGIPALNGYLYLIDNVAGSLDNIYNELHKDWAAEYTLFAALCDRVNYFEYSSDYTDTYAAFGDSIFFHYSWIAPTTGVSNSELPEYASDWSYHYSDVFDRKLRYTVHCFVPTDRHLEPYLIEQFAGYYYDSGSSGDAEFIISQLPRNVVFHLLRTFSFDKQDIIFPTEVSSTSKPLTGHNGEVITVSQDMIQDVKMCTNGIIYGLDTLLVSNVFNSVIAELMSNPDYSYYANALTATGIYEHTSNPANIYTIFARSDSDLLEDDERSVNGFDETLDFGTFEFYQGSFTETTSSVSTRLNNNLVYGTVEGIVPRSNNGEEADDSAYQDEDLLRRRYYRTVGSTTSGRYIYTQNGSVYDEVGDSLTIYETYDSDINGVAYIVDRELESATGSALSFIYSNGDFSMFYDLLKRADLSDLDFINNTMMFIPPDSCMYDAIEMGYVPQVAYVEDSYGVPDSLVYTLEDETHVKALATYLRYYFVSTTANNLSSYVLPGLGGGGITSSSSFSLRLLTQIPYIASNEMEYVTISWTEDEPDLLTLTENAGNEVKTNGDVAVQFGYNAICYVLQSCFDYRTMYQYQ